MNISTGSGKGFGSQAGTATREERLLTYTSTPVPHWFYHENSLWHPYSDVVSSKLEETNKDHSYILTIDDYTFDLAKMTSFKKGASKMKHLRRGTWFYKEKNNWTPYETIHSNILESKWQKGEFKQPVCIVESRPQKFVEFKNGIFMQFKQNKPSANKEVQRGWEGKVLETVTETTSIITTVTRDAIITGPGSPPYSKPLQPGVPFHSLNLQQANSLSDIQYVPVQSVPSNGHGTIHAVPSSGHGTLHSVPSSGMIPIANLQQYPSNGIPQNMQNGGQPVYYQLPAPGGQPQHVQMISPVNGYNN
jgi:hypothetical protein